MNRVRTLQSPALVLSLLSLLWVIVIVGLFALKPSVLSVGTITTVLQFSTILALVSLGQGMVILAGGAGIDLSVGGTVSLSAVLGMLAVKAGLSPFFLPFVCIGAGTALGAFNGVLVTKLRILPLIATLGTFFVYSGVALSLTGGSAQSGVPDWLLWWGRGVLAGIPVPFLTIAIPAFAIAGVVLAWTSWGRWVYAMGFNERSARLVGIPVDRTRLILYSLSGTLAGAAGSFFTGMVGQRPAQYWAEPRT